jgi:outer membrane protein assembly factor BamB
MFRSTRHRRLPICPLLAHGRSTPAVVLFLLAVVGWQSAGACGRADTNWTQFRGPNGGGTSEEPGLPVRWSTTQNVVWKAKIPGRGWSSPIVWRDKIFVTSVLREGQYEEAKKGLYFGGDRPKPSTDVHRWMTYCLDFQTGKVLWERQAHQGAPTTSLHVKNTYASETPVTDGERLYAYFGNLGLFCYDLEGKLLWSRRFKPVRTRAGWGLAASPVLHQGRLYLVNDNEDASFLIALDGKTGQEVWRVSRDEKSNWATPFIWENDRRTELITPGATRVRSYDLAGKQLWELAGMSSITIPTPQAGHGLLYVSSGYVLDTRRPIFAIRPGGSGDISPHATDTNSPYLAWSHKQGGPYNPSPLVYGPYLYVLYDQGMLSCYDATNGKLIYDKQRLRAAQGGFTSSPWAYHGKIFCLGESGDTFVIKAGPEFKLLARNSLDEMCMATPALAHGSLLVRTLTQLYRIEEKFTER